MPARHLPGIDLKDAAKQLGTGRTRLCQLLRELGHFNADNVPRHALIKQGLFVVDTRGYRRGPVDKQYTKTLVTGAGMAWLHELIEQHPESKSAHRAA